MEDQKASEISNKFLNEICNKEIELKNLPRECIAAIRVLSNSSDDSYVIPYLDEGNKLCMGSCKQEVEYQIFYNAAYADEDKTFKTILKHASFQNRFRWFSNLLSFAYELKVMLLANKSTGSDDESREAYHPTPAQRAYIYLSCMSPCPDGIYPCLNILEAEKIEKDLSEMKNIEDPDMLEFAKNNCAISIIDKYIDEYISTHNNIVDAILTQNNSAEEIVFTHHIEYVSLTNILTSTDISEFSRKLVRLKNPFSSNGRTSFGISIDEIKNELIDNNFIEMIRKKVIKENRDVIYINDLIYYSLVSDDEIFHPEKYGENTESWDKSRHENPKPAKDSNEFIEIIIDKMIE